MTVEELIALLQKYPKDMNVYTANFESTDYGDFIEQYPLEEIRIEKIETTGEDGLVIY